MTDYVLEGLTDGVNYTVSVSVLYAGGGLSQVTADEIRQPGLNTDNDTRPDSLDPDDDNDGVNDTATDGIVRLDACPRGDTDWTSNESTDHDGDGCRDDHPEDPDDDNDGVNDLAVDEITQLDACPRGDLDWTSNASTDNDGDGCRDDSNEDLDDDNDGVNDLAVDEITQLDACPRGDTGWTSAPSTDNDGDGCRDDSNEDLDDDNDGVKDTADAYPLDACASVDTDGDDLPDSLVTGCLTTLDEDPDDDNDEILDTEDVDDNNNSLRDIRTLDDLASLRDDLNGNGTDDGMFPEITAMGSVGCPSSGCNGYELSRSLNFSDPKSYADGSDKMAAWTDRSGSGWAPIGSCSRIEDGFCTDYAAYVAKFDGQDHTIADLFISAGSDVQGVGLFAAFNGSIQNLHPLGCECPRWSQ